eukprot:101048_1
MGAWYSDPLVTSIYTTIKQYYAIEIPSAICAEIIWYSISINTNDIELLNFVVEGDKPTQKDYHLDFILDDKTDMSWSEGMGTLLSYPQFNKGCWKFEMLVKKQGYGMAIGMVDIKEINAETFSLKHDFEHNKGCYGYYHGGSSLNICGNAKRVHTRIHRKEKSLTKKWSNKKVGIWVDFDNHKLAPVHNETVFKKYAIDIPANTSYCFYFWLHRETDNVSVYPPYKC